MKTGHVAIDAHSAGLGTLPPDVVKIDTPPVSLCPIDDRSRDAHAIDRLFTSVKCRHAGREEGSSRL
jgi:hypothetical protein